MKIITIFTVNTDQRVKTLSNAETESSVLDSCSLQSIIVATTSFQWLTSNDFPSFLELLFYLVLTEIFVPTLGCKANVTKCVHLKKKCWHKSMWFDVWLQKLVGCKFFQRVKPERHKAMCLLLPKESENKYYCSYNIAECRLNYNNPTNRDFQSYIMIILFM